MTSTLALACAILRRPRREAFKFLAKTLVRVIVTKQKLPALVYYLMSSLEPSTGLGDELENVCRCHAALQYVWAARGLPVTTFAGDLTA